MTLRRAIGNNCESCQYLWLAALRAGVWKPTRSSLSNIPVRIKTHHVAFKEPGRLLPLSFPLCLRAVLVLPAHQY